jgi:2-keto-4-pentenoate hydratase/2-oxohepta-3-ene-1,7-dioic acid hydratase in catechol pathway
MSPTRIARRGNSVCHPIYAPKGKSADTFAPIGPYLVTADEVRDPQTLEV